MVPRYLWYLYQGTLVPQPENEEDRGYRYEPYTPILVQPYSVAVCSANWYFVYTAVKVLGLCLQGNLRRSCEVTRKSDPNDLISNVASAPEYSSVLVPGHVRPTGTDCGRWQFPAKFRSYFTKNLCRGCVARRRIMRRMPTKFSSLK